MNDVLLYLFWFVYISCGSLSDSRMWGNKEEDLDYVKTYTDLFWLGWVAVTPFAISYLSGIGVDILSWKSFLIACGMSVWWDMLFVYNESRGAMWFTPIPIWLAIPNPFSKNPDPYLRRIVIGFNTLKSMMTFNYARFALLVGTLFI